MSDEELIEALRRYREAELPDAGYAYLADALESTLAELRQERERADEGWRTANELNRMHRECHAQRDKAQNALSRAEETIARARAAIGDANEWNGHGRADQLDSTRRILSGYEQNREEREGNKT